MDELNELIDMTPGKSIPADAPFKSISASIDRRFFVLLLLTLLPWGTLASPT